MLTKSIDEAIIDAFMQQYNGGQKVNCTSTTTTYDYFKHGVGGFAWNYLPNFGILNQKFEIL